MAPNMSLSTGRSPKALGMIFSRRRSSRKEPLEEVRGPDRAAVGDRHAQVGDAGLEVVLEAGDGRWQLAAVVGDDAGGEIAGDRPARRLVGGLDAGLELGPLVLGHLGGEVAHAVRQAALAGRAREAGLDRLDDARRAVGDDQQRVAEPAGAHVLEEGA